MAIQQWLSSRVLGAIEAFSFFLFNMELKGTGAKPTQIKMEKSGLAT